MSLKIKLSLIFFISFLTIGAFTLPHYGINWDEPTHFLRGQAFLHYYLSGKKDYKNLPEYQKYYQKADTIFYSPLDKDKNNLPRRSIYQNNGYEFNYWVDVDEKSHPPLSGIMASSFNYIFFQKLGLINDVDSYNLFAVFVASILVAVIFFWVSGIYGRFSGAVASFSLFLYPLFLSESHFNIKDVPETVFYSLTLITFYEATIRKSFKWLVFSSFLFALAFSVKLNIVFAFLTIAVWFLIYAMSGRIKIKKILFFVSGMIMYPLFALLFFIAFWPAIWEAPLKGLLESLAYYKGIGISTGFDSRYLTIFGLNTYPLRWILYTTPLVVLFLTSFGLIYLSNFGLKEKNKITLLIFLWLIFPILRVTMPGASIYGGARQIMEYIPAMAILSGIGAKYMVAWLHDRMIKYKPFSHLATCLAARRVQPFQLLIILSFVPIALKLISIHPNEGVYFNPLIGGLEGAKEKDIPYWGETLGNPYKQGLIWINKNAEKNAKLVTTYGLGPNLPSIFIRPDVDFHNGYRGYDYNGGEYIIGLSHKNIYENTYYLMYVEKFLNPVYEVKVDGVSIMKVWKNDRNHTKPEYKKELYFTGDVNVNFNFNETSVVLDITQEVYFRRLKLFYKDENCVKNAKEINLQTSLDKTIWTKTEDDAGKYIIEVGFFDKPNVYNYYFTGIKARYIKIDFGTNESCLKNLVKPEIYIVDI